MTYTWRRKGGVKPRKNEDAGLAICRTMIEDFTDEVVANAMQAVAKVTGSAGLGDDVERLKQPIKRFIVERLAARIAAGAETQVFEHTWVVFLAPAKPERGAPDRRAQVLQLLDEMAEALRADLPHRPDPMTTLCGAMADAAKYGPAIDKIVGKTVETILKRLKRADCQGLRHAVMDQAASLFLEMDEPDIDRLALFMKVSIPEWIKRVVSGGIL